MSNAAVSAAAVRSAAVRRSAGGPLGIALATLEYPPDPLSAGIGSYTHSLAQLLAARGHRVHVVTRGTREDTIDVEDGIVVHRLTPVRPQLPDTLGVLEVGSLFLGSLRDELRYRHKLVRRLEELAARGEVDLIETADHFAETVGFDPRRFPQVPFVTRLHTPLAVTEIIDRNVPEVARRFIGRLERKLIRKSTHVTAPSGAAARFILAHFKLDREVVVYPNPPSLPLEVEDDDLHDDGRTVLFVGRINKLKGPDILVQTIPGVLDAVPDARFVFVGSDNVPAEGYSNTTDYLLSLLPRRHHGRVTFTGHIPHSQVNCYFRSASVVVLPSLFESFGYTCLEAMTYGRAIVGSASGGMNEMLAGGEAGLLFTPPYPRQLQEQIIRLLSDAELRRQLGERARRRAVEYYSEERVMQQAEEFYARAIWQRRR